MTRASQTGPEALPAQPTDQPFDQPVTLIGFGEAGQAMARGWRGELPGLDIRAYDIKTGDASCASGKWHDYAVAGITGCASPKAALSKVGVVFSLVTADQALSGARKAAAHLGQGALYFDGNSCAPGTKRAAARVIGAAGGRYVDMAIMAPVHPRLHKVPLLLSGPHVQAALPVLVALGMQSRLVRGDVGRASSVKMMRSVMVKGLEALALECFLAARRAGVHKEVLASLGGSFPGFDWPAKMAYDLERVTTHGVRRAAEMREAAKTVEQLGLMDGMSRAIVDWQQAVGDLGLPPGGPELESRADAILAALGPSDTDQEKDN